MIETAPNAIHISNSKELYQNGKTKSSRLLLSTDFWKLDYHHVPIRKWLFDRKQTTISYDSSIDILTDHSDEHIYAPNNANNVPIGDWINTNKPDAFSSDLLSNKSWLSINLARLCIWWISSLYVCFIFCSQNSPRIEYGVRVLAAHWSSYLMDKYSISSKTNVFNKLAGLYIRRGDKSNEDSFWFKHSHWRNISYYIKGIVDEEKRLNKTFQYIFVMTDDKTVMHSLQDYVNSESKGTDEPYARKHLRGREILYNVLAPQACFDPFLRIGFDQFLVSMRFLIQHSAFTVGHTDSNVFRFFREIVYAQRQHQPGVQTYTYVQNAPNSFDVKIINQTIF